MTSMGIRKKKTLMEQASDYVEQVRPHVEQAVETARDRAVPLLTEARDKAVPVLEDARDRAKPIIADGAAIAAEKAAQVADVAQQKAAESRDLAAAKVAELKGEEPKKKGGKLKKFMIFGAIAAAAAFVASKLRGGQDSSSWNSSYTPTPPPAPAPAAPRPGVDDSAGSSPDEALADAAESAHEVTTPDDPAEEVVVDEGGSHKLD